MFKCLACGLPWWLSGKESACQVGDAGSTPEWGRSPGEGNGIPPQSSHLGNPMDRGAWPATVFFSCLDVFDSVTPWTAARFPVLHHLPELAQTHVHWVSDAIQPSHPLSPPSPPAFNLSQHQGLSQWVSSLHQGARVLELQLQYSQWGHRVRHNLASKQQVLSITVGMW